MVKRGPGCLESAASRRTIAGRFAPHDGIAYAAAMDGLWIPLTIGAAFAQTLRNAAQRSLVSTVGTLGATLVRFLFALPFAAVYTALVFVISEQSVPSVSRAFLFWVLEGGIT